MSGLSITLVINSFSVMLIVVGMWSLLLLFGGWCWRNNVAFKVKS